jgi:hypothetical protein
MLCPNGHEVEPGQRYCPACGAAVSGATPPPPPAPGSSAEDASSQAEPRRSHPWVLPAVLASGVVLVAVVAIVVLTSGGASHTINGSFSLLDPEVGAACVGSSGYDDIGPGTTVTVRNEEGETIGTGRLSEGVHAEGFGCDYTFSVEVPKAQFYRVEVSHRGELEYSASEMEENNWEVATSLG